MKQSQLFTKTIKSIAEEEKSVNAALLIKAGFVDRLTAGVYTYLPLGLRVLNKINNIVREEMNAIGGQEILMPALTPAEIWQATNRWDNFDALFKLKGADEKEYALGATHEEVVTPLLQKFVLSYKDLPKAVYQIQTKFRNEKRAKSGILRGREFVMKDLYSFHANPEDLDIYYDTVTKSYFKIFERLGLKDKTYLTFASGGSFSKYSHEFQTVCERGEDTIYICPKCLLAYNKEIIDEITECQSCGTPKEKFKEEKAIETGNIFKLMTKYSAPFKFEYTNESGKKVPVIMGCYGLGPSRCLGAVVEVSHDDKGIIWPEEIAPFKYHLIVLGKENALAKKAELIYNELTKNRIEVLFDDREESAGVKLADADLIGLPYRVIYSAKTAEKDSVEIKPRNAAEASLVKIKDLIKKLK